VPPTAEEWIDQYARALGLPAPDASEIAAILQLASVAAHASERLAAPVACYLAARAGRSLEEAQAIADALSAGEPPPEPAPPGR
jgi:hypothetical protein